ncbi:MAG: 3-dehydroquinate synthase, partial [Verrucomicrobia bacterium]|nr:3-dehydroquinate synthase [Verrucomicrobiota bacterium]
MKTKDKVHVELGDRSYDISIGEKMPIGTTLATERGLKALIISDSNVDPVYGKECESALEASGFITSRAVVPAGEASKDLKTVGLLYEQAIASGLDRSSVIVALGGGVVGDLAGFVAATFLRGVRLIQVPTSLLAMVDSSVGGKTGVNLPQGKNLVGAFYQPVEVVADMNRLGSLPEREYRSGLAEVIKYGVIWDAGLFRALEENVAGLICRDLEFLKAAVARCCEIKAEIVGMDEKES